MGKYLIIALAIYSAITTYFIYNTHNELKLVEKQNELMKAERDDAIQKMKDNDTVVKNTINSLNSSLIACQTKQDELTQDCNKRIQLILDSKEEYIYPEDKINDSSNTKVEQDKVKNKDNKKSVNKNKQINNKSPTIAINNTNKLPKGIDEASSEKYISEFNKAISQFNNIGRVS